MTQDDLTPWQDTPLVQALTSGATADELSGQNDALAAFRAVSGRRRRGVVRFLGTGATSVALVGVVGGGVAAAAYTRSLPTQVQSIAHDVLGPIGVPAPTHHKARKDHGTTLATGTASASPSPGRDLATPAGSASPAAGQHSPEPNPGVVVPGPHVSASASPQVSLSPSAAPSTSPTASPTPSPSGPAGDPSTWAMTATVSARIVHVHDSVQISGTLLDADGQPVADHRVVVRVHVPGTTGATRAVITETDSDGNVSASLSDLTTNRVFVLGAGDGVHSKPLRVIVKPVLSVSASPSSDGTSYIVTVTANGGQTGDVCTLLKHTPQGWQQVGQAQLDGASSASFAVQTPPQHKRFVVRLAATKLHAAAAARLVLPPN